MLAILILNVLYGFLNIGWFLDNKGNWDNLLTGCGNLFVAYLLWERYDLITLL